MKISTPWLALGLLTGLSCQLDAWTGSHTASTHASVYCRFADTTPRSHPSPGSRRHYAPNRQVDILHLALDVTPDFEKRSVSGNVTLQFKPIAVPLSKLSLDGENLEIKSVTATQDVKEWHASDEQVIITFATPIRPDQKTSLTVQDSATPKQGLYFRTPEMGYPADATHLWTQGEPIQARHWFPCYDFPNEKFTSEVTCRVPPGMVVLSNGRKISETKTDSGLVAVRWLQDKPHVNYLISLVAGHFKSVRDQYKGIPMAFHVPPSEIEYAQRSFDGTKDMMAYFEQEIGLPYPWDKYDQVCVLDFHWGGMENTSLTTLNISTLHTADSENIRSSQGLVAHELVHQWFGNLVTCRDWSHLWLNEGFATYYEALYDGHKHGRDELLYRMHKNGQGITGRSNDTKAMVRRDFSKPEEQFGYLAYPKGAWILHMLRSQLGPDLYRRCIRTYLERHQFGIADTEDLISVLEELTGRSFDAFFDQYVYHAHHPELAINYRWDSQSKQAKIQVQQKQKLSPNVLLFQVNLPVRFKGKSGVFNRTMRVTKQSEDFNFPLPEAPEGVRIDPDLTLLAKIIFAPPTSMLHSQLDDSEDMLGRLMAVELLGKKKERNAVDKLKTALNEDPFYGVRLQAAQALRAIGTDQAYQALQDSRSQSDARVRRQVIRNIGSFFREETLTTLLSVLENEKNPEIKSVALTSLSAYPDSSVWDVLLEHLEQPSFRNQTASAAIQALRTRHDPAAVSPLLDYLEHNESRFTHDREFGQALDTLALLARDTEDKDAVLQFLLGHLEHEKQRIRQGAIRALGTLGDLRALATLKTFTESAEGDAQRATAERAIKQLEETPKSPGELGKLRSEILDLQKNNRELRKDFDELKKKLNALTDQKKDD